ncbi:hypothetical protein L323_17005 [Ruminiclostridium papyrosolvens C7]|uniref:Uncharacterized protein n=1 Tax=Ruminiclostridium papyrosolvens C7 TaxID=1330534 RepID=U4QXZ2_9FIRM|nr:hypothetical protein L323_17005 [Ruminiclostridium papyrosolvens C7]
MAQILMDAVLLGKLSVKPILADEMHLKPDS